MQRVRIAREEHPMRWFCSCSERWTTSRTYLHPSARGQHLSRTIRDSRGGIKRVLLTRATQSPMLRLVTTTVEDPLAYSAFTSQAFAVTFQDAIIFLKSFTQQRLLRPQVEVGGNQSHQKEDMKLLDRLQAVLNRYLQHRNLTTQRGENCSPENRRRRPGSSQSVRKVRSTF
ncbi:uncharacterized protein LAESUDRAFT_384802 [Laetiporus sulphureus 93-53]|uniref:Uncharacterized protein n=1 Tax=Laetiporus sulphureus 93-53 TaxID=1314785 RepID=A0A165CMW2_9APHY|nr:uncharacterized protein LAESUDRAFT_384802 [Laetiporus sulphureus 93-53]KZT03101.1 hypothetical protein LAESUDRAFT_384802 [Laetiporus sulphureus 93-53]